MGFDRVGMRSISRRECAANALQSLRLWRQR